MSKLFLISLEFCFFSDLDQVQCSAVSVVLPRSVPQPLFSLCAAMRGYNRYPGGHNPSPLCPFARLLLREHYGSAQSSDVFGNMSSSYKRAL